MAKNIIVLEVPDGRFAGTYEIQEIAPREAARVVDQVRKKYRRCGEVEQGYYVSAEMAVRRITNWQREDGTPYSDKAVRSMVLDETGGLEVVGQLFTDADEAFANEREALEKN